MVSRNERFELLDTSDQHTPDAPSRSPVTRAAQSWLPVLFLLLSATTPLWGMGFTDESAFVEALDQSGLAVERFDFEDTPAGTVIENGDRLGPLAFGHAIAGGTIDLAVADGLPTTSGSRFLGLAAGPVQDRQIQHGDRLRIRLLSLGDSGRPAPAFGLKVVSGDPLLAGDIRLSGAGLTVTNAAVPAGATSDGGRVYFLGLVAETPIEEVTLDYGFPQDAVAFLFTVDDIELGLQSAPARPVPVRNPVALALLVLALFTAGLVRLASYARK